MNETAPAPALEQDRATTALAASAPVRRPELDWLRVLAFGVLIPFHAALGFLPSKPLGFSNNETAGEWLTFLVLWVHQWRLPVLFLVAGMGTAYALRRRSTRAFLADRALRLLVPLLAGVLLVLPVHTYFLLENVGSATSGDGGFLAFLLRWWGATAGMPLRLLDRPTDPWIHVQHLWFLLNLFLYCVVFSAIVLAAPLRWRAVLVAAMRRLLGSRAALGLLTLAVPLLAVEVALKPLWTGRVGTGYEFPWFLLLFVFGILLAATGPDAWQRLVRIRWPALVLGVVTMAAFTGILVRADAESAGYGELLVDGGWASRGHPWVDPLSGMAMTLQALNAWVWTLAFVAWVAHVLRRPGPRLAYATGAVYTSYIVHLSFVLAGLFLLRDAALWWPIKFVTVAIGAAAASLAFYEVARRTPATRLLFAVRPIRRGPPRP